MCPYPTQFYCMCEVPLVDLGDSIQFVPKTMFSMASKSLLAKKQTTELAHFDVHKLRDIQNHTILIA